MLPNGLQRRWLCAGVRIPSARTAAKFINKSSLFVLLFGFILQPELLPGFVLQMIVLPVSHACTKPFVSFSCLITDSTLKVIVWLYSAADVELKRTYDLKNFVTKARLCACGGMEANVEYLRRQGIH